MGSLKLAYPLLCTLFVALVLCTENGQSGENEEWTTTSEEQNTSSGDGQTDDGSAYYEINTDETVNSENTDERQEYTYSSETSSSSTPSSTESEAYSYSDDNESGQSDTNTDGSDQTNQDSTSYTSSTDYEEIESDQERDVTDDEEVSDDVSEEGKYIKDVPVSEIPEDDKELYVKKHKFLKKITFKDLRITKYRKIFYSYFRFNIRSETFFKFIKHCYRHKTRPNNHNKVFKYCIRKHKQSGKPDVKDSLFTEYDEKIEVQEENSESDVTESEEVSEEGKYIKDVKVSEIPEDDNELYVKKHKFLKKITFKDLRITKYRKIFYSYFRFNIRSETFFKFIKHCYRHKTRPKNHNKVFKHCIRKHKDSGKPNVKDSLFKLFDEKISSI